MKKKTLLFGGAFDPPHKSHIRTALTAIGHKKFNGDTELWFLPCYSDAFGQKKLSAPKHRIAMLGYVLDYLGRNDLKICTTEIEMANFAGTYAIVTELRRRHPDREFYYVIGSDQAARIREWRNSRDLLKTIPFVIVKRPAVTGSYEWCFSRPHIWIETSIKLFLMPAGNIFRSSEIRESFHSKWKMLNEEVPLDEGLLYETNQYIIKNKLYKE
jgi:Nicotinic acid mononucleotide adenylyltransferase